MTNNNIPVHFCIDFDPIPTSVPVNCNNISVESNGVEIPMSDAMFAQMIEGFFTNSNFMCVFDGGDANTVFGVLDTMILL